MQSTTKPTLYVLCGLPGSGKSTYSKRLKKETTPDALILSSDDIRDVMNVHGREYRSQAEQHLNAVIHNYVSGCLLYGRDVIVDATNLRRSRRMKLQSLAVAECARKECHWVRVPLETNKFRSRTKIDEARIDEMDASFVHPAEDEGWDNLVVINGCEQ